MGRVEPSHLFLTDEGRSMDERVWEAALQGLELGPRYYFDQVGSTNDVAEKMIDEGTPDLTVVIADEQVRGRGRHGRSWVTPPGSALAFSVVLLPQGEMQQAGHLNRLNGLGALAVARALRGAYSLPAEIKWPNDVLIESKKVCGILVESRWQDNRLMDAVVGIGVNVDSDAVPDQADVRFPASSLEEAAGREIPRPQVLASILRELVEWYPKVVDRQFIQAWEGLLAFRDQPVRLQIEDQILAEGVIRGLEDDGSLRVEKESGMEESYPVGEIHLRPVDRSKK